MISIQRYASFKLNSPTTNAAGLFNHIWKALLITPVAVVLTGKDQYVGPAI
jgi:hypothetical protein